MSKRMKRRGLATWSVVGITTGALVIGPLAAGAVLPAAPAEADSNASITFDVLNATDQALAVTDAVAQPGSVASFSPRPKGAANYDGDAFGVEGHTGYVNKGDVTYRIGESGYSLSVGASYEASAQHPPAVRCAVLVNNTPTNSSPYRCKASYDDSTGRMNAHFVIEPVTSGTATVGTDQPQRRFDLAGVCDFNTPYARCTAQKLIDVSSGLRPSQPIGSLVAACTKVGTVDESLETRNIVGSSSSLGTASETKLLISEGMKLVLRANYSKTWTDSLETRDTYTLSIAPQHYGWIERAAPVTNVTADYEIKLDEQVFLLPAVTISSPSTTDSGVVIARSVPIAPTDHVCEGKKDKVNLKIPVTPVPSSYYRIALHKANQSVIGRTAGDTTSWTTVTMRSQAQKDLSQQWELLPVAGHSDSYQIVDRAYPGTCLGIGLYDARSTASDTPCMASSDQNISYQLWRLDLDPDSGAYRLASLTDADVYLSADGSGDGARIGITRDQNTSSALWDFSLAG